MKETQILPPGQEDSPGVGNGNPHRYSCLKTSMDRRAWQAAVHEVTKGQTQLNTHTHTVIVVAAALAFCLLK